MARSSTLSQAYSAADRSDVASSRLLAYLAADQSTVNYRDMHDAFVAAILAHVEFADLARAVMRESLSHGRRRGLSATKDALADYAWAREGPV